jgi:hypothetical protein
MNPMMAIGKSPFETSDFVHGAVSSASLAEAKVGEHI